MHFPAWCMSGFPGRSLGRPDIFNILRRQYLLLYVHRILLSYHLYMLIIVTVCYIRSDIILQYLIAVWYIRVMNTVSDCWTFVYAIALHLRKEWLRPISWTLKNQMYIFYQSGFGILYENTCSTRRKQSNNIHIITRWCLQCFVFQRINLSSCIYTWKKDLAPALFCQI